MEGIPDDEKNYIIVQLVLTGISPLAVRKIFDKEFHPACLKSSLNKEFGKINQLKNRGVLNQAQINILYPKDGMAPSSSKFDISLMLCLLRNFTDIDVHDQTPQPNDTSIAADLGRIKYYRNKCSHTNESKLSSECFSLIWNDITEAIQRLGGIHLYAECQTLKQRLETSDQKIICEIVNEMQSSRKEIEDVKEEMLRSKEKYTLEIDLLRAEQQEKDELQELFMEKYEIKQNIEMKRNWRENLSSKRFFVTKAVLSMYETLLQNQYVAVSGMSGSGKSMVAQHTALRMSESHGYIVVLVSTFQGKFPLKYDYTETSPKILYVLDDVFGKFSISDYDHVNLNAMFGEMKFLAEKNINCRFLITTRPNAINVSKIKEVLPSIVECNLHSPELTLSLNERRKIFDLYIPGDIIVYLNNDILERTEQLPLLCTLYRNYFCNSVQDFFLYSDEIIASKIEEMRKMENISYICLALLLVVGDTNTFFSLEECIKTVHSYNVFQSVISESTFTKTSLSRGLLLSGWKAIEGIYVKREGTCLSFIHDKIYDIVISYMGRRFIKSILMYAEYSLIENRVRLESFITQENTQSKFIILDQAFTEMFFARMLTEIKKHNKRVFGNIHNEDPCYRKAFIDYLKQHLSNSDLKYLQSPLVISCRFGYEDFVSYIVGKWKTQLIKTLNCNKESPLSSACLIGNINIVKMLIESCTNPDLVITYPLINASEKGFTDIVKFLITYCVYPDVSSALNIACKNGNSNLVEVLLETKIKCFDPSFRDTSLRIACENGNDEIAMILLNNGVPVNYTALKPKQHYPRYHPFYEVRLTPLYCASMKGYLNTVKLLLKAGAKVDESDISVAEWNDHEDIAKYLRQHFELQNENNENLSN